MTTGPRDRVAKRVRKTVLFAVEMLVFWDKCHREYEGYFLTGSSDRRIRRCWKWRRAIFRLERSRFSRLAVGKTTSVWIINYSLAVLCDRFYPAFLIGNLQQ